MRLNAWAMLVGLLIAVDVSAQDSYLCIEDMATGFKYDRASKKWIQTNFTGDKYLVTRMKNPGFGEKWEVKQFGKNSRAAYCEEDFNSIGSLWCQGFHTFSMNKNTLRFLIAYLSGYYQDNNPAVKDSEEGGNSPYVAIGKCSAL